MSNTHTYPCDNWIGERSCAICRGIADEKGYILDVLKDRNDRRQRLGLPPISLKDYMGR